MNTVLAGTTHRIVRCKKAKRLINTTLRRRITLSELYVFILRNQDFVVKTEDGKNITKEVMMHALLWAGTYRAFGENYLKGVLKAAYGKHCSAKYGNYKKNTLHTF